MHDELIDQPRDAAAEHDRNHVPFEPEHSEEGDKADRQRKPIDRFAFGKEDVEAKPNREIQDHADDCRGHGGERGGNDLLPRNCSMCGAPRKIHRKQGTNVAQVVMNAPSVAANSGDKPIGCFHPPMNPTNWRTMISGPGSCFRKTQSVHHLARSPSQ